MISKRKTGAHISVDPDVYEEFRLLLEGTSYRGNASAAIRDYIYSAVQKEENLHPSFNLNIKIRAQSVG